MKQIFIQQRNILLNAMVVALVLLGVVGCATPYDDTQLREEIEQIKGDLAALEERVESELNAIKELIEGSLAVSKIEKRSDGSTLVTLSDDTQFSLPPKGAAIPKNLITVITGEDGLLYWAQYNADGKAVAIKIGGEMVSVTGEAPQTRLNEESNAVEVSFDGGQTWIVTGYTESEADALIADIEIVYSTWQKDGDGNPVALYCIITLADGSKLNVAINTRLMVDTDMLLASNGSSAELNIGAEGAVDYVLTLPKGWECDVEHDAKEGKFVLTFISPLKADVEAGKAVAEGVAKIYVVFDNGSAAIASIVLSGTPISVSVAVDAISITAGGTIDLVLCGLVEKSAYNVEKIVAESNKVLGGATSSEVYSVEFAKAGTVTVPVSELCAEVKPNVEYLFWYAVPKTKGGNEVVDSADVATENYILKQSMLDLSFEITETSFFDATMQLSVKGSEGYVIGINKSSQFSASSCVDTYEMYIDNGFDLKGDGDYKGSVLTFFGKEGDPFEPGTKYTIWFIESAEEVTADDVKSWEFATKAFTEGGDLEIDAKNEVIERRSISVELDTAGHIYLYHAFVPEEEWNDYANDEAYVDMLLSKGEAYNTTESVVVKYSDAQPGDKFLLVALAVDEDGVIGKLFKKDYATKTVEYNALSVSLAIEGSANVSKTTVKATCEGAKSYAYVCFSERSEEWIKLCGETVTKAEDFIVDYVSTSYVHKAGADGVIELYGVCYPKSKLMVMAVDDNGIYSHAALLGIEPTMDVNNVIAKDAAGWATGKPALEMGKPSEAGDFYVFDWYIKPVEGYVAYSYAMPPYEITDNGLDTDEKLIAHIIEMSEIENVATRFYGKRCEYSSNGYCHIASYWGNELDTDHDNFPDNNEYAAQVKEDIPGVYNFCRGIKNETLIYTTWMDEDGNFHAPFVYDPTQKKEVE